MNNMKNTTIKELEYKVTLSIDSFVEIKTTLFRAISSKEEMLETFKSLGDEEGIALFEKRIASLKKAEAEMEESRQLTR